MIRKGTPPDAETNFNAAARLGASLACAEILARDPEAHVLGGGIYRQPETAEGEREQRELALDRIHAMLEGTPRPKEPAVLTLNTRDGRRIEFRFDSLTRRKRRTPSVARAPASSRPPAGRLPNRGRALITSEPGRGRT
jgi:hypothetical protein